MHFEILVEDSSGTRLLENVMPKLIGPRDEPHTWRLHTYRGIGRIPKSLDKTPHVAQRLLLSKLPALLRGYVKTPGYDAIIVICDTDARDCVEFLRELQDVAKHCGAEAITMFRLAIEEIEAWYFGDRKALLKAYPQAKKGVLDAYVQDSLCNTWERLADCVYPGGSRAIVKSGWPTAGDVKHEWADRIGPFMDPDLNRSPGFAKLRDGMRKRAAVGGTARDFPF